MQTYDQLQAQIEELQKQANEIKGQEKSKTIADMKIGITKYSITAAELGFTTKQATGGKPSTKKATSTAKYQKQETGETWSGRGPKPKWLADELEAGKTKEDFLVK